MFECLFDIVDRPKWYTKESKAEHHERRTDSPKTTKFLQPIITIMEHQDFINDTNEFNPIGNPTGICGEFGVSYQSRLMKYPVSKKSKLDNQTEHGILSGVICIPVCCCQHQSSKTHLCMGILGTG